MSKFKGLSPTPKLPTPEEFVRGAEPPIAKVKAKKDRIVFVLPPGIGAELDRAAWLVEPRVNRSEVACAAFRLFNALSDKEKVNLIKSEKGNM